MQPFNLEQFAAQAQAMQDHIAEMQSRLMSATVTEQAGDGLVSITLGAHGGVTDISIDPSLLNPSQRGYLESLLIEAFSNASESIQRMAQEHMRPVSDTIANLTGLGETGLQQFRQS